LSLKKGGLPPMSELILETESDTIMFEDDAHILHTHKRNFAQRRSLDIYLDFESAKRAVDADLNRITWKEVKQ
jgi:hypothetical protein